MQLCNCNDFVTNLPGTCTCLIGEEFHDIPINQVPHQISSTASWIPLQSASTDIDSTHPGDNIKSKLLTFYWQLLTFRMKGSLATQS